MKHVSLIIIITAFMSFNCKHYNAVEMTKSFEDYKVHGLYIGPKAPINNNDLQDRIRFKTRIVEGFEDSINFAGKYIWVQWGCGTSCQTNVIIDAEASSLSGQAELLSSPFHAALVVKGSIAGLVSIFNIKTEVADQKIESLLSELSIDAAETLSRMKTAPVVIGKK